METALQATLAYRLEQRPEAGALGLSVDPVITERFCIMTGSANSTFAPTWKAICTDLSLIERVYHHERRHDPEY